MKIWNFSEWQKMKVNRGFVLLSFTALIVAYVRREIQYGYFWRSIFSFLGEWLISWVGVVIVTALVYEAIQIFEKKFFHYEDNSERLQLDKALFYISVTILVSSIFILVLWVRANAL